jgi:hypothetical protein
MFTFFYIQHLKCSFRADKVFRFNIKINEPVTFLKCCYTVMSSSNDLWGKSSE